MNLHSNRMDIEGFYKGPYFWSAFPLLSQSETDYEPGYLGLCTGP